MTHADRLVVFLVSGRPHLPYLICSLRTLREHWSGPVMVAAWPESYEVVAQIASDYAIHAEAVRREPEYRGHCDQFLDKIQLVREQRNSRAVLYIDADTTIHGPLDVLFEKAESCGFCATQFNDWTMGKNGIPQSRIKTLLEFPEIPRELIEAAVGAAWPSVNGGVFACHPQSPVLEEWHRLAYAARRTYIADEKVLHLMVAKYAGLGQIDVALGGRWNCSPRFQPKNLPDSEVVIFHFHGDSNVKWFVEDGRRVWKARRGFELWWPIWQRCLTDDVGGCRGWWWSCGNKWLDKIEKEGVS